MSCRIHQNDIGTIFQLTITDCNGTAIDLTTATTLQIVFTKPDGVTKLTKTAVVYSAPVNGIIRYTAIAGDLDQTGKWFMQAQVTMPAGSWKSDIKSFRVYPNL